MEKAVLNILDRILESQDNLCRCEKCRLDIAAIALNNLPSKYVVTNKGELYTKVQEMEIQFEADIIREITKAIEIVSKNPRHDED
jgi:competence protein ComFB